MTTLTLPPNPTPRNTTPSAKPADSTVSKHTLYGIGLAVLSNVLFGVLFAYSSWLAPLSGTQVFVWRIVAMWGVLLTFLLMSGKLAKSLTFLANLKTAKQWAWLLIPTPIFASQFWLFMWAPVNGQGTQVAMGYFLFPLSMVLSGYVFLGERLTRLQWVAVGLAGLGVAFEIIRTGQVSWATLWVCGTYPIFYLLRRKQGVPALTGMLVDTSVILPFALAYLLWVSPSTLAMVTGSLSMALLVAGLGAISVLALQTNVDASKLLPMNVFGMLSYLEPALLFVLSVTVLGGAFEAGMAVSYGLIWAGIGCLIWQGMVSLQKSRKQKLKSVMAV